MTGLLILSTSKTVRAQEAVPCSEALAAADAHYVSGAFGDAIDLLTRCLDDALMPESDLLPAFRILALSHLRRDDTVEARMAVVRLLSLYPQYEADPVQDPPPYSQLLSEIRQQLGLPSATVHRCDSELTTAELNYAEGDYDAVLRATSDCLARPEINEAEALRAHRLQILAYMQQADTLEARMTVVKMLGIDPGYEPEPTQDSLDYVLLVSEIKEQLGLPSAALHRCDRELAAAETAYNEARYDAVLNATNACLNRSEINYSEQIRSYRLQALVHMQRGDLASARATVARLLEAFPDYTADPVQDPPSYAALVRIIRLQREAATSSPPAAERPGQP